MVDTIDERISPSEASETSRLDALRSIVMEHPVAAIFLAALSVRVVVSFTAAHLFGGALIQADSLMYHDMASSAATGETGFWDDFTHSLYLRTITFVGPLMLVYKVFGVSLWLGALYVALLGAGTAAIVTAIAKEALPTPWALVSGGIVAFLPSQVFWSSVTLKDAMVWLLLAGIALTVAVAARSDGWKLLACALGAGVLLVLLGYTRSNTLVVACWALALTGWVGTKRFRPARIVGALALAVIVPWALGFGPAGWQLITGKDPADMRTLNALGAESAVVDASSLETAVELEIKSEQIRAELEELQALMQRDLPSDRLTALQNRAEVLEDRAEELRERATELRERAGLGEAQQEPGGGVVLVDDGGSLAPNLRHLPRGISVMLLEPFPWDGGGSTGLGLARLESLVWYPILILALLGLPAVRRHPSALFFPIVFGGATVIVYALTEGNLGTAYRHRGEFIWVVALLAGFGAAAAYSRRRQRRDET